MRAKHIPTATMEDPLWDLFDKYVSTLNRKLRKRGLPTVHRGRVVGAIMARFLLAHRLEIMEEHAALTLSKHEKSAIRALGPELAAISFDPQVPHNTGTGSNRSGQ